jgi:hypothetical protein
VPPFDAGVPPARRHTPGEGARCTSNLGKEYRNTTRRCDVEKEPLYGEEEGQEPFYGEEEPPGKAGKGRGTDTATRTAEETGTEADGPAGMRPTGSGGSAPPN